jgi:hypothetical protein
MYLTEVGLVKTVRMESQNGIEQTAADVQAATNSA